MNREPGELLGARYRLERALGVGAGGGTWLARDEVTGSKVAVKIGEPIVAALEHEFDLLRGLGHPRLVSVEGLGRLRDGQRFLVTEWIDGTPLDRWAHGRDPEAIDAAVADALEGLVFLHDAGLLHNDFKPANVVVDGSGRATLVDLGCASRIGEPPLGFSGTPAFAAPERLDGAPPDELTEVASAGATLLALHGGSHAVGARAAASDRARRPPDVRALLEALGRAAPPRAGFGAAPALLERETELALFETLCDALIEGREGPRALLVEGRDGVGRTRLLREMVWRAQLRCDVRVAFEGAPHALSSLLGRLGDGPPPDRLERVLKRRDGVATDAPVVIALDDAHALAERERGWLRALVRSARSGGGLLLLIASRPGVFEELGAGARALRLGPLSASALARWSRPWVSPERVADLQRVTGGVPADVERLLAAVASGAIDEGALGRPLPSIAAALPAPAAAVAAALAASDGRLRDADALAWGVDLEAIDALQRARWLRRAQRAWVLTRPSDLGALVELADPAALRALHRSRAEQSEGPIRARHLALAGDLSASIEALPRDASRLPDPRAWLPVLDAIGVARLGRDPAVARRAAEVAGAAGESRRALSILARALLGRPPAPEAARLRLAAGWALLRAGAPLRAERTLARALRDAVGADRAAVLCATARALVELGQHERAAAVVDDGLEAEASAHRAALLEVRGITAAYLGRDQDALAALDEAWSLASDAPARERAKLLGLRGIAEFRAGRLDAARDRHAEALRLAERGGLSDHVATAALNLATVEQQLGEWGAALLGYERAARTAEALGRGSTGLFARYNLANLYVMIGVEDRARHHCERTAALAERHGSGMEGHVARLRGEVERLAGRVDRAAEHFERAHAIFSSAGMHREVAECAILRAEGSRRVNDAATARRWLAIAQEALGSVEAVDLRARAALVAARLDEGDEGRASEVLRALEAALDLAKRSGELLVEGEAEAALASAAERAGAHTLARAHAERARAVYERVALTLPSAYRSGFEARLARLPSSGDARGARAADEPGGIPKAERLLEINKKLNSDLSTDRILEHAIDAAIELTHAERGFVVVDRGGALTVATARNLDRERVGRSHLKFSHSIAQSVVTSGEPLLTTDARHDERFAAHASVHAMRLSSIVCVPITAPSRVLGAIYLDNRFERGRFTERDVATLCACADQVAIALTNAQLVADLEARGAELERERARVEALLVERDAQIELLEKENASRAPASEIRHAYREIVGRGRAMRDVLAVVDRVVDSSLSVVIGGESGTGKELVARAIHEHGARTAEPFLAVNCAALPDTLLEGELFGWRRGAFTGADRDRDGIFVRAHGGTVFLDEVGETSAAMQAKLLRVLQQGEVQPLGSTETLSVDVRVVAATNRDLRAEVAAGRFREDLYYRIAVVEIALPPLRERGDDLVQLTRRLLERCAAEHGVEVPRVHPDAMRRLAAHPWPGNVRELQNVLSRALVMGDGELIRVDDLGLQAAPVARTRREADDDEQRRILEALRANRWNVSEVARRLGIPRTTLYRRLQAAGIDPRRARKGGD